MAPPKRRPASSLSSAWEAARQGAGTLGATVTVWWVLEALDFALALHLDAWGVQSWSLRGLLGIFTAPVLHHGFAHLLGNTLAFLPLGALAMARSREDFYRVGAWGALSSGLFAWALSAPGTLTVGASGVIFAYLGFLMARGVVERRLASILLSLLVTWLFGGMLWGMLPTLGGVVSWQGHLGGWLGGVWAARQLSSRPPR